MGPGGGGGGGHPGHKFPGYHGPFNFAQPWMDGYYPSYDLNDRSRYYDPYPSLHDGFPHGHGISPAP
jgi:hypothetical protein